MNRLSEEAIYQQDVVYDKFDSVLRTVFRDLILNLACKKVNANEYDKLKKSISDTIRNIWIENILWSVFYNQLFSLFVIWIPEAKIQDIETSFDESLYLNLVDFVRNRIYDILIHKSLDNFCIAVEANITPNLEIEIWAHPELDNMFWWDKNAQTWNFTDSKKHPADGLSEKKASRKINKVSEVNIDNLDIKKLFRRNKFTSSVALDIRKFLYNNGYINAETSYNIDWILRFILEYKKDELIELITDHLNSVWIKSWKEAFDYFIKHQNHIFISDIKFKHLINWVNGDRYSSSLTPENINRLIIFVWWDDFFCDSPQNNRSLKSDSSEECLSADWLIVLFDMLIEQWVIIDYFELLSEDTFASLWNNYKKTIKTILIKLWYWDNDKSFNKGAIFSFFKDKFWIDYFINWLKTYFDDNNVDTIVKLFEFVIKSYSNLEFRKWVLFKNIFNFSIWVDKLGWSLDSSNMRKFVNLFSGLFEINKLDNLINEYFWESWKVKQKHSIFSSSRWLTDPVLGFLYPNSNRQDTINLSHIEGVEEPRDHIEKVLRWLKSISVENTLDLLFINNNILTWGCHWFNNFSDMYYLLTWKTHSWIIDDDIRIELAKLLCWDSIDEYLKPLVKVQLDNFATMSPAEISKLKHRWVTYFRIIKYYLWDKTMWYLTNDHINKFINKLWLMDEYRGALNNK